MRMEKFWLWLANKLPKSLVYWSAIRVMAYATTGKWGYEVPDSVSIMTALDRWERKDN